jgi:hypothetical protein
VGAAAILAASIAISAGNVAHGKFAMGDFKAFYCAGYVLAHGGNPYLASPLARCEATYAPSPLFFTTKGEVLPAPLPGYAVAAFAPLSLLPFPLAALLWLAVLTAATMGAIALLRDAGVASAELLAIAMALTLVGVCFPVGELPPIALFGVALAAWSASRNRPWLAAAGIALTFCEPQVGAAMLVAALAMSRRLAIGALVAVCALGLVSLLAVGVAGNLEYARLIVPAHLISELPSVLQYSLSAVLYQLGVAPGAAVLAGRLSWLAMLGVTFAFARSRHVRSQPALAFLAAPAFVAVGGPFLHLDQIALAIPAALWIASHTRLALPVRIAIIAALALPVLYVFSIFELVAVVPFIAMWIGGEIGRETVAGMRTAAVAIVVMAGLGALAVIAGTGSMHDLPAVSLPGNIAQASWARYIAAQHVMTSWAVWFVKLPVWCGVIGTAAALVRLARGRLQFAT